MSMKARVGILLVVVIVVGLVLVVTRLGGPAGGLQAAFDAEFLTRPDGYKASGTVSSLPQNRSKWTPA